METVKGIIALVIYGVFGITIILNVLYVVIGLFYELFSYLFSPPKCPNCAKVVRKKAIRCPSCGNPLKEKPTQDEPETMNAELYARVKAFVAEWWRTPEEKLTPETHLADDLGIAGDDGYELLEAFCKEFEIQNMSEINPYDYFDTEGCNAFGIYVELYYLVFDRKKLNDPGITPLYLRDLVKSAEAKRWIPSEA